jgi:hypothetical protein
MLAKKDLLRGKNEKFFTIFALKRKNERAKGEIREFIIPP